MMPSYIFLVDIVLYLIAVTSLSVQLLYKTQFKVSLKTKYI